VSESDTPRRTAESMLGERTTLADVIREELRKRIITLVYWPGTMIFENVVAAEFKVSRYAGKGPHEQESLRAQRQNAGPFANDQAERGQRVRRCKARRAGEPIDDEVEHELFSFNAPSECDAASKIPTRRRL